MTIFWKKYKVYLLTILTGLFINISAQAQYGDLTSIHVFGGYSTVSMFYPNNYMKDLTVHDKEPVLLTGGYKLGFFAGVGFNDVEIGPKVEYLQLFEGGVTQEGYELKTSGRLIPVMAALRYNYRPFRQSYFIYGGYLAFGVGFAEAQMPHYLYKIMDNPMVDLASNGIMMEVMGNVDLEVIVNFVISLNVGYRFCNIPEMKYKSKVTTTKNVTLANGGEIFQDKLDRIIEFNYSGWTIDLGLAILFDYGW
jgi:hypothetical protein